MAKKKIDDAEPEYLPDPPADGSPEPAIVRAVGRVCFEDVDGNADGEAFYDVPADQRERLLVWRGVMREQNRQLDDGTWIYRTQPASGRGHLEQDAALTPIVEKTTKD